MKMVTFLRLLVKKLYKGVGFHELECAKQFLCKNVSYVF